jgi:hypothetical protein
MIPWISTVYEYLVDCYRIMQFNDLANMYQNILDKLKSVVVDKRNDFILEMEKEPPKDLHYYVSSFLQK